MPVVPVVYEAHVRGMTRSPSSGVPVGESGTFAGLRRKLPYLADLGVTVIELLPVHPFDPATNYWGYMPLVWGAVHEPFAGSLPSCGSEGPLLQERPLTKPPESLHDNQPLGLPATSGEQ